MKRILQILFVTILAFCLPLSAIFADASSVTQDQVDFSLDLTEQDGVVSSEVKIVNNSGKDLKNLRVETGVPDGLPIPDDIPNVMTKESLPAGKALTTILSYNPLLPEDTTLPEEGINQSGVAPVPDENGPKQEEESKTPVSAEKSDPTSAPEGNVQEDVKDQTSQDAGVDKIAAPTEEAAASAVVEAPQSASKESAQAPSGEDLNQPRAAASAKVTQASEENVKTGSETAMAGLFIALALMFFVTVLIFTAKKKRGSSAGMLLSIALAALLMQGFFPAVKAADTERGVTLEKTIALDGQNYTVMANISYVIDTDETGLPTDEEDQEPDQDQKDASSKNDTVDQKPADKQDDAVDQKPDGEKDGTADQKPADKKDDATDQKPADKKDDTTDQKPADKKDDATDQKPADKKDDATDQKPADKKDDTTDQKPADKKDDTTDQKDDAADQKPADKKDDTTDQKPADTKNDAADQKPSDDSKEPSGAQSGVKDETPKAPVEKTFKVTIKADGNVKSVTVKEGQTVADALSAAGITLSKDDVLSVDQASRIGNDTDVTVSRVTYKEVKKTETILFGTYEEDDSSLETGTTKVVQKGENGQKDVVYLEKYVDGVKTETTVKSETVTKKMVSEKIKIGTGPIKPKDITPDGAKMIFSNGGNGWIWPIDGNAPGHFTVTSIMGTRESPGGIGSTNHKGTDIAANTNSKILAVADGTVIQAGPNGGYGNSVTITTPQGYTVLYGHLNSIAVTRGQSVKQGATVGYEGSTGNSTGPHLHFEVRNAAGVAVNGLQFYGQDILNQLYYCD